MKDIADTVFRSSPCQPSSMEPRSLQIDALKAVTSQTLLENTPACTKPSNHTFVARGHSCLQLSLQRNKLRTQAPTTRLLQLTEAALANYNEQYGELDVSFDTDVRERAVQEAGRKMGFNIKLDCYEADKPELVEWYAMQKTLFREPPIFKDRQDLVEMGEIAVNFGAALANIMKGGASGVALQKKRMVLWFRMSSCHNRALFAL
jgi:hypothetical protein